MYDPRAAIQARAEEEVARVWDDPQGRLAMRRQFYQRAGPAGGHFARYGDSELAFMEWEIARGVLGGPEGPGSAWWKEVNGRLLVAARTAALAREAGAEALAWPAPTRAWIDFLDAPTDTRWYRAHNTSIVEGYTAASQSIGLENRFELAFVNIVLYRLLFAQAMVEGSTLFPRIAERVAAPEGDAVDLLVHLPDFYPTDYPLTRADYERITGRAGGLEDELVRVMDAVILQELGALYSEAARWNDAPWLPSWQREGQPAYPAWMDSPILPVT